MDRLLPDGEPRPTRMLERRRRTRKVVYVRASTLYPDPPREIGMGYVKECLGCRRKVDTLQPISIQTEGVIMFIERCEDCTLVLNRMAFPQGRWV